MAQESTRRYAEGKTLSVIDGIPVGIKEEFAVVILITVFTSLPVVSLCSSYPPYLPGRLS